MSGRWPGFVYDGGEEPDYRFTFANERTFLAWIRTALALLAAGVAVDTVDLTLRPHLETALAATLVGAGLVTAGAAWVRWALAERAVRRAAPLPGLPMGVVLASLVAGVGLAYLLLRG